MNTQEFALDIYERIAPLGLDDEKAKKVVDIVFWAMDQVRSDQEKQLSALTAAARYARAVLSSSPAMMIHKSSVAFTKLAAALEGAPAEDLPRVVRTPRMEKWGIKAEPQSEAQRETINRLLFADTALEDPQISAITDALVSGTGILLNRKPRSVR